MASVATITVAIQARVKKFQKTLAKATKLVKNFARTVAKVVAIAATAGFAAVTVAVTRATREINELAKTATRLGVLPQNLAALQAAAIASGVKIRMLNMALQRFIRRVGEAAQDTGEAKQAIKDLGFDAAKLVTMPVIDRVMLLAKALDRVKNDSERLRLAFKLFDSEGVVFLQILKRGTDEMERLMKFSRRVGFAISDVDARKVELAVEAWDKMKIALKGVWRQLSVALAPFLEAFFNWVSNAIETIGATSSAMWVGFKQGAMSVIPVLKFMNKIVQAIRATFFEFLHLLTRTLSRMAADINNLTSLLGVEVETLKRLQTTLAAVSQAANKSVKDSIEAMKGAGVDAWVSRISEGFHRLISDMAARARAEQAKMRPMIEPVQAPARAVQTVAGRINQRTGAELGLGGGRGGFVPLLARQARVEIDQLEILKSIDRKLELAVAGGLR